MTTTTVICDIETERLDDPQIVWVVCVHELGGERRVFFPHRDGGVELKEYWKQVDVVIGHNWLKFDGPVLNNLFGITTPTEYDTLVLSQLLSYNLPGGHSLAAWGERFKFPKGDFKDFHQFSKEMVTYCHRDVDITLKLYALFREYLEEDEWKSSIDCEHRTARRCNDLSRNGFAFDVDTARRLLADYQKELAALDEEIKAGFPPKYTLVRTITPRGTLHGTIHKGQFQFLDTEPFSRGYDLSQFAISVPFSLVEPIEFNPGSPKAIVSRLNDFGWKPTDKTKGHIKAEREKDTEKLKKFREFGWTISEENLATLPDTAPTAAHSLVKRLTLASRVSDLEEWLGVFNEQTGRIHGSFNHIGCWTHRMSHYKPNMANIPGNIQIADDSSASDKYKAPLNKALRSLWIASPGHMLVGCDADSIQLRAFAHYINDEEFIYALQQGNKTNKTDPHSVNQRALGSICRTRDMAKTFIYSFLMGAGIPKLAQVLDCSISEATQARENFMLRYPGYAHLRNVQTKIDAQRGYFIGLDGRKVPVSEQHKVISGYLQNFEVCIMKHACDYWEAELQKEDIPYTFVNFVHDEWQTETIDDKSIATRLGEIQSEAITKAGEVLNTNCPQKGSFDIGYNWYDTH